MGGKRSTKKPWWVREQEIGNNPAATTEGKGLYRAELERAIAGEAVYVLVLCKGKRDCLNVYVARAELAGEGSERRLKFEQAQEEGWIDYFEAERRAGRRLPVSPSHGICGPCIEEIYR